MDPLLDQVCLGCLSARMLRPRVGVEDVVERSEVLLGHSSQRLHEVEGNVGVHSPLWVWAPVPVVGGCRRPAPQDLRRVGFFKQEENNKADRATSRACNAKDDPAGTTLQRPCDDELAMQRPIVQATTVR